MNAAQSIREKKELHPEQFCRYPRCLWRIARSDGTPIGPCGSIKHPHYVPVVLNAHVKVTA